ncbi:MAG: heavy metal translocating P-type ATPase [Deltaproteobacteria bacterium]|nr:heavy metal translocating P-type ATPase [Deltaproteobacteria bacterium]
MGARIVHELPGRLRLELPVPRMLRIDPESVEAHFHDVAGVERVSFRPRRGTLLVRYDGRPVTRSAVLERAERIPRFGFRRARPRTELERERGSLVRSGILLLLRPVIPPPIGAVLAVRGAFPVLRRGAASLLKRRLDVAALDGAAVGAALSTGDLATASMISFLLRLGEYLEEWTKHGSRRLLARMFHVEEEWAWVLRGDEELRLPLDQVREGDVVVVRSGSLIPVEGAVAEGEALVNQASLTGESLAVRKAPEDPVYAGTAVEEGTLKIRAAGVGGETRAARVIRLIEEAEGLKAEHQSHGERLADRIVPFSFLLSGLTLALTGNASRAAAVLLVDYSCAIKLSTPIAILSSLAKAAEHGVLIKGGKYLEKLAEADAFVFDKTGTLTEAVPNVVRVVALNGHTDEDVLRQAACLQEHFPHPLATAVTEKALVEGLPHEEDHAALEYITAHGIASDVGGERVLVGSRHFVCEDEGIDSSEADGHVRALAASGYSVVYVARGDKLMGLIALHDRLRKDAGPLVRELRRRGIRRILMLTGDEEPTANRISELVGIPEFRARVLPDEKVEVVKALQREGYTVALIGDGINDTAALAHADVGISLAHGAEVAREACDVLLKAGDLASLLEARQVARDGMTLIEKNFRTIIAVNSAAMLMAMTGLASPTLSALVHNAGTIAIGLRALTPLRHTSGEGRPKRRLRAAPRARLLP